MLIFTSQLAVRDRFALLNLIRPNIALAVLLTTSSTGFKSSRCPSCSHVNESLCTVSRNAHDLLANRAVEQWYRRSYLEGFASIAVVRLLGQGGFAPPSGVVRSLTPFSAGVDTVVSLSCQNEMRQ